MYDKELFNAIAAHVSANFTKYETEDMLKMAATFAQVSHLATSPAPQYRLPPLLILLLSIITIIFKIP